MATYRVKPSGTHWEVEKGRRTVSNHRKKRPAVRSAKGKAGMGDTVVIHRANGTIQNRVSY